MAKCPQCQERQRKLRDAIFNAAVVETLKQAGLGLVELTGLKEKDALNDVDGNGPAPVGSADEGKDDGRPANKRGRHGRRDDADDSKRGESAD